MDGTNFGADLNTVFSTNMPAVVASGIDSMRSLSFTAASSQAVRSSAYSPLDGLNGIYTATVFLLNTGVNRGIFSMSFGTPTYSLSTNSSGYLVFSVNNGSSSSAPATTTAAPLGSVVLVETNWQTGNPGFADLHVNGAAPIQGGFTDAGSSSMGSHTNNYLGVMGSYYMDGMISEHLVYDHPLSPGDIGAMECYFKAKYPGINLAHGCP